MKDGGPAFPAQHFDLADGEHGMTLRDWFAGMAMQGFCSNPNAGRNPIESANWLRESGAVSAYQMADAMIQERSKT